ncbi:MAG: hypothetical protein NC313_12750 [Butyrivibrio sp.]|nr:hypothetical protein [Butyrivibrio sp.]
MDILVNKLSQLSDPTSADYTSSLRKIAFNELDIIKNDEYFAILNNSDNNKTLRFSAFYCLFIQYRRFEQRYELFELVESKISIFEKVDKLSYLYDIVMSQYNKFKCLDTLKKSYYKEAVKYANKAINEYSRKKSYNIGCFNNYADIVLDVLAIDGIVEDKDISCALKNVDMAIHIHEKERNCQPYANYYCSKARLFAYQKQYEMAKKMITLAISYERTDQKDSLIRLSNYHDIKLEIKTKESLEILETNISEANEKYNHIQNQLNGQQTKYIEILSFFAATIALIMGSISISLSGINFLIASSLIMVLSGCLILSYIVLVFLFSHQSEWGKLFVSSFFSITLIVIGILIGKGTI